MKSFGFVLLLDVTMDHVCVSDVLPSYHSLPCYVSVTNNTVHRPRYVMRISSSDSFSCVSISFSEPPPPPLPIMFHSAWQTWPASCQSPGPKSFRQSTSLLTHTHLIHHMTRGRRIHMTGRFVGINSTSLDRHHTCVCVCACKGEIRIQMFKHCSLLEVVSLHHR